MTKETRNDDAKTLQFERVVSRLYRQGPAIVNLYVAYWGPDKVPPRTIGLHT